MFIAMNRFRVAKGSEEAFEDVWLSRDSHMHTVTTLLGASILWLLMPETRPSIGK
jgi:heme-degrading monooxygenase HmoA